MAVKIQIKRGTKAGLPALSPGEYGLATDTGELFIGGANGNIQVATLGSDGKIPGGNLDLSGYVPTTRKINNKALSADVTLAAGDVGAVPTSRTVNGKALSSNIILTASDVGLSNSINLSEVTATMPSSANWFDVAYGGGKFVAITQDNNKAAYSTDGLNWSATTLPSSIEWRSVTYGNGKFIAVADNSAVAAYSTDGINWDTLTLPRSLYARCITYGGGRFVITCSNNLVAYSVNGTDWEVATMPSNGQWNSVTYGNGKFVAVAFNSNKAAYSTDGINWTAATLPSSDQWKTIAYGNGKFVTTCGTGRSVAYSTDGASWTAVSISSYVANWSKIVYGDGKFVILAYGSNKALYSTNGADWVQTTLPSTLYTRSATYGNGKFVVTTNNNSTAYSTDGINWHNTYPVLVNPAGTNVTDKVAQALGSVKVETGEYTGTNTYGESNPTVLSFSGKPFLVLVLAHQDSSENITYFNPGNGCWGNDSLFWVSGTDKTKVGQSSSSGTVTFIAAGNTLSFYASSAQTQMNASNYKYRYAALTQAGGDT